MTDYNNMTIYERFQRDASEGAPVWYAIPGKMSDADGFVLYEPASQQPWTWVSSEGLIPRLLQIAPQATRIWIVPNGVAEAFLKERGWA